MNEFVFYFAVLNFSRFSNSALRFRNVGGKSYFSAFAKKYEQRKHCRNSSPFAETPEDYNGIC